LVKAMFKELAEGRRCGSGSGSPSVGPVGWWASTVDPAPARANDPTIPAWTTHSVIECA